MLGTPVIASRRGGLAEIISNDKTGFLVEPNSEDMAKSLRLVIGQNNKFRDEIKTQKEKLIERFELIPLKSHISLYAGFLDKIYSK
jgi:glycosyltransferase involved in cell wall biosynthesis